LPNVIDPYNFEPYRFKVGAFFETQCITMLQLLASMVIQEKYNHNCQICQIGNITRPMKAWCHEDWLFSPAVTVMHPTGTLQS